MSQNKPKYPEAGELLSFDTWLHSIDRTRSTGWRWRSNGTIETINVFGKLYVTRDAIAEFERRALAGDFSREVEVPTSGRRRR